MSTTIEMRLYGTKEALTKDVYQFIADMGDDDDYNPKQECLFRGNGDRVMFRIINSFDDAVDRLTAFIWNNMYLDKSILENHQQGDGMKIITLLASRMRGGHYSTR